MDWKEKEDVRADFIETLVRLRLIKEAIVRIDSFEYDVDYYITSVSGEEDCYYK